MSCSPVEAIRGPHAPAPAAGELALSSSFRCAALHATIPVGCCLLRQAVSERQRNRSNLNRGQGSSCPSCTERCAQGAEIRRAAGERVTWRGRGLHGVFDAGRRADLAEQDAARERLRLVGALDPVPCLDEPPPEEPDDTAA